MKHTEKILWYLSMLCLATLLLFNLLFGGNGIDYETEAGTIQIASDKTEYFCELLSVFVDEGGTVYAKTDKQTVLQISDGKITGQYLLPSQDCHIIINNNLIYILSSDDCILSAYDLNGNPQENAATLPTGAAHESSEFAVNGITYYVETNYAVSKIVSRTGESEDTSTILTRGSYRLRDTITICFGVGWIGTLVGGLIVKGLTAMKKAEQETSNTPVKHSDKDS